jgi:hypothetical protein
MWDVCRKARIRVSQARSVIIKSKKVEDDEQVAGVHD